MKVKLDRLAKERLILSSQDISSQTDLLEALAKEGVKITQATLSRDLKQLKVAKAASTDGAYRYVLPSDNMYKRVVDPMPASEMMKGSGVLSITFTGTLGVIRTRPGFAASVSTQIDASGQPEILGTIAGYDTIFIAVREGTDTNLLSRSLGFSD